MSVEFNDPQYAVRSRATASKAGGSLSNLAVRSGLAKDGKSAQIVLIIVALLAIGGAVLLFMHGIPEEQNLETPKDIPYRA